MSLVTVAIPTYNTPPMLLGRAISTVLEQTVTDIEVIVVNDGGPPIDFAIDDSRVRVIDMPYNWGRYLCDHKALGAARGDWFVVCDADDWVEPDWLETMLAGATDDCVAVLAPHWEHARDGRDPMVKRVKPFDGSFRWHAHMGACQWRTDALRELGATNPHVRFGWDNVMTGIPLALGRAAIIGEARYHRVKRAGSLTQSKATGMRSAARARTLPTLKKAWADVVAGVPIVDVVEATRATQTAAHVVAAYKPANEWALPKGALAELDVLLWSHQPRRIVELGSGWSTVVLSLYASRSGAEVISLEHDRRWYTTTRNMVLKGGDLEAVDLRLAPLKDVDGHPMYDTDLPDGIDFVLIDGPPEGLGGRAATFPQLLPHLTDYAMVYLDDGDRPAEAAAAASWSKSSGWHLHRTGIPHGLLRLTSDYSESPPVDFSDITLTVLCGRRPTLLRQTLESLPDGLLETAEVVVVHNGGDTPTLEVLDEWSDVINVKNTIRPAVGDMAPMGKAMGALAELVGKRPYVMHLEDDWVFATESPWWWHAAVLALEDETVSQVRLRHVGEQVRTRHMVTDRHFSWDFNGCVAVADAHLTCNPSMMRAADFKKLWPADGEMAMQKRAYRLGMHRVAQLYPGAFWHRGGGDSLRVKFGDTR